MQMNSVSIYHRHSANACQAIPFPAMAEDEFEALAAIELAALEAEDQEEAAAELDNAIAEAERTLAAARQQRSEYLAAQRAAQVPEAKSFPKGKKKKKPEQCFTEP